MEYRRIIMQMNYYENLWIELPDGIQKMTEDEKSYFYPQMSLDFAWIDKNSSNIYCIKRQLEVSLEKKNVKVELQHMMSITKECVQVISVEKY